MFDAILRDLEMAEKNLDVVWRRACMAEPYAYPEKSATGLYAGGTKIPTSTIQARYVQYMYKTYGRTVRVTPTGIEEYAQLSTAQPMPNETEAEYFARTGMTMTQGYTLWMGSP